MTIVQTPPRGREGRSHLAEQDLSTGTWTLQKSGPATGQDYQVGAYLASSLIISYPCTTLTLKPSLAFPQPAAGHVILLQKHRRVWLLTRGMQPAILQTDDERGYFCPRTSAGLRALVPRHTLSCFYCFLNKCFPLRLGIFLFESRRWNSFRNFSGLKLELWLGSS